MKTKFSVLISTAMILLCIMTGIATAAYGTQNITYQGRLTDAGGNPLSGTYSVTFRLYNESSGGTVLAAFTNSSVQCTSGIFTTPVTFDPDLFDGQGLWIGITVGADPEMTPRQEIRPVPYALMTKSAYDAINLRPGAVISGSFTGHILKIWNNATNGIGLNVTVTGSGGKAVFAQTTGPNSTAIHGESAQGIGVYGKGKEGGYFTTNQGGTSWPGPAAVNVSTGYGFNPGIRVNTSGDGSEGVYANTRGNYSYGVIGYTDGTGSPAVYGESVKDIGVYGKGREGGYFTTNQAGSWGSKLAAVNVSTDFLDNVGIRIRTSANVTDGIFAQIMGGYSEGINLEMRGDYSDGLAVLTYGSVSPGVKSQTFGDNSTSVNAWACGPYSDGLSAISWYGNGVYASTSRADNKYGVLTPDIIRALNYETGASDVAEYMPVTGEATAGTVLVIGKGGVLQPCMAEYDTRVAGIVSTAPGVTLGSKEGGNTGEALVAVAGKVPCLVDATNGPIQEGDLLTTSSRPGYAMKADPIEVNGRTFYPSGIVLGKAMGTLERGTGVIEVLVTLQ